MGTSGLGIVVLLLFGVIMAWLAGKKGYNPALWFLTGIIGLLILTFLPFVNEKSALPESQRQSKKKNGDRIGGVISAIVVVILLIILGAG